ncbi:hypothetical protein V1506DRAFT_539156 [Lipomyces tetrasporus]
MSTFGAANLLKDISNQLTHRLSTDPASTMPLSHASAKMDSYDTLTTSFSIPYMMLLEPEPADVVFVSRDGFRLWNDPVSAQSSHPADGKQTVRSLDNLGGIRRTVDAINEDGNIKASAVVEKRTGKSATITMSGPSTAILTERATILRKYYEIGIDHVGIDTFQLLDSQGKLQPNVRDQLEAVAAYTSATIFVTKVLDPSLRPQNPSPLELEDIWKPYHILAYGDLDSIAFAKTRLALLIDEMNGLFIDRMSVALSLHPLLAGRDQVNFQKVTQDTGTKLYTPTLFPCVHSSMDESHARRDYDEIYIVGQETDVDSAREMIENLTQKLPVFSKDFVIPFAKIDFLLLHSLDKLEELSRQNGAFIQFPSLGASRSSVRVQCPSHIFVEKTIRSIAKLVCDVYSAGYWIHEGRADDKGYLIQPRNLPPVSAIREALERISSTSGADISFLKCTFDVIGDGEAAKSAVSQIRGLPFWPSESHQVRFRIELSVDQREFIAGKKNGKINRIMSTAHVWIKFEPFSEYNFFVDLVSPNYAAALFGMQLLEEELPAEISFYIPEAYHRSIIGTGGQQIQTLMRKYNVFVKFSNAFEQVSDLGIVSRIDNVVVRCPAKNAESLLPAKNEIHEIVQYLESQQNNSQSQQALPSQQHGHHHHNSHSYPAPQSTQSHTAYPPARR